MILLDSRGRPAPDRDGYATLDDLLRRAAERHPDALALIDPPNRDSFTDGPPRRLTYRQADRMVSAIAERLRRMRLAADAVIGIQMANTVDGVLTLLGILRAEMIAMVLPPLWRHAEATAALRRVAAKALVVSGRIGGTDHFDLAMNIAAEIFPVRYVCGFGDHPPDGIIPFDDLYDVRPQMDPPTGADRIDDAGAHLAVITWDQSAAGLVPVARSHAELIAGALAALLDRTVAPDSTTLLTLALSSFASLAVAVVPWLISGNTLALHQPFDPESFRLQRQTLRVATVIVPGPIAGLLAQAGQMSAADGLSDVVAVWRAPERLVLAPAWTDPDIAFTDVQVFGEVGLVAATRGADGLPAPVRFGRVQVPGPKRKVTVVDLVATSASTVALRGVMVPQSPFPPGAERTSLPYLKSTADGWCDTGYACRLDRDRMVVTSPPPGVVSVGGARFSVGELRETAIRHGATLAVVPGGLTGHRLSGHVAGGADVRGALQTSGAGPLLVEAFRPSNHRSA